MKHDMDYIASYYMWRETVLKPCSKANWKAQGHCRYISVAKATMLKHKFLN